MTTELPNIETDERIPRPAGWPHWLPLLIVAAVFGVADFAVAPLMKQFSARDVGALLVFACLGMIPAQFAILSIALVFGEGKFWVRLAAHWCLSLLLGLCWAGGFLASMRYGVQEHHLHEVLRGLCALPVIALATQLPLWPIRCVFGSRLIRRADGAEEGTKDAKLTIADLFAATAVVAVSLGAARGAPLPDHLRTNPQNYWTAMGLISVAAAGLSLISIPVVLWFFAKALSLVLAWFLTFVYGLAYWILLMLLVATGVFGLPFLEPMQMLDLMVWILSYALGIAAALTPLRDSGVVLTRRG